MCGRGCIPACTGQGGGVSPAYTRGCRGGLPGGVYTTPGTRGRHPVPETVTAADGTHPYWNAFFLFLEFNSFPDEEN